MGGKLFNILIWTLVIIIATGLVWVIVEPIIWWTDKSEIRICIRLFLIFFAIQTFATLRLYNAIVVNTRFTIKLREAMTKMMATFPVLERLLKTSGTTMTTLKTAIESLRKEIINLNNNFNNYQKNEVRNADYSVSGKPRH